ATTESPPRARGRAGPPDGGGVPHRQRAGPPRRIRHGHGSRGLRRPGARPHPGERNGERGGKDEDARGSRQCRAVPARPAVPRAAPAHQPRAALRARSRRRARPADRRRAQANQGGRGLIAGVALVAKPAGPTSHDVVDQVRRALATRRVGHLGTLDPFAAGLPDVRFRATVSGGTYLRSLARDVGEELRCGAHLAVLVRTQVGPFRLDDAVAPEALTIGHLRDPATLVAGLPRRELDEAGRAAVIHGRPVSAGEGEGEGGRVALFADGPLVAVAEPEGELPEARAGVAGGRVTWSWCDGWRGKTGSRWM